MKRLVNKFNHDDKLAVHAGALKEDRRQEGDELFPQAVHVLGIFHSANIHNPDPISTHFVSGKKPFHSLIIYFIESERFDKDFAVADQKVRAAEFDRK